MSTADDDKFDHEGNPVIIRYHGNDRTNHWVNAVLFVLLALSGLSMFHPAMAWLALVLGGGQWTRILHPFLGVTMFVSFALLMLRFWRSNFLDSTDRQWLKQMPDVIQGKHDKLPAVGKYNAGQKLVFWVTVVCMLLLVLTGIVIWRAYFSHLFPIELRRWSSLLHAIAAFVMILTIIIHVYAGIWVKGSFGAMINGKVTWGWARKHHPLWWRDEVRKDSSR